MMLLTKLVLACSTNCKEKGGGVMVQNRLLQENCIQQK
jgi:hypothetical protein